MKEFFMTYWLIGIIYVVVWQVTGLIYMRSRGNDYIPNDLKPARRLTVMLANITLTLIYPIFTIIMMVHTLHNAQQRRHTLLVLEELKTKLNEMESKDNSTEVKNNE